MVRTFQMEGGDWSHADVKRPTKIRRLRFSGCGTVERAVGSETRGPRFESYQHLLSLKRGR